MAVGDLAFMAVTSFNERTLFEAEQNPICRCIIASELFGLLEDIFSRDVLLDRLGFDRSFVGFQDLTIDDNDPGLQKLFDIAFSVNKKIGEILKTGNDSLKNLRNYNIERMLSDVSEDGYLDAVRFIISLGRLGEISLFELSKAFRTASDNGHPDVVRSIIDSDRFGEIDVLWLGVAFKSALENGHLDVVRSIIDSDRFGEISDWSLSYAFKSASENGHLDVVRAIIDSDRFGEISEWSLSYGLKSASENGHLDVVRAFIDSGRFREIPDWFLSYAIDIAKANGRSDIARIIRPYYFIKKVFFWGLIAALAASHIMLLKSIMK